MTAAFSGEGGNAVEKDIIERLEAENRVLSNQRLDLAAALGYDVKNEWVVPTYSVLVKKVGELVDMRKKLNQFRRFLSEEE